MLARDSLLMCSMVFVRHGLALGQDVPVPDIARPIHHLFPGATNPEVTQATINTTICQSGWTATIRPPASYTTSLKKTQMEST